MSASILEIREKINTLPEDWFLASGPLTDILTDIVDCVEMLVKATSVMQGMSHEDKDYQRPVREAIPVEPSPIGKLTDSCLKVGKDLHGKLFACGFGRNHAYPCSWQIREAEQLQAGK